MKKMFSITLDFMENGTIIANPALITGNIEPKTNKQKKTVKLRNNMPKKRRSFYRNCVEEVAKRGTKFCSKTVVHHITQTMGQSTISKNAAYASVRIQIKNLISDGVLKEACRRNNPNGGQNIIYYQMAKKELPSVSRTKCNKTQKQLVLEMDGFIHAKRVNEVFEQNKAYRKNPNNTGSASAVIKKLAKSGNLEKVSHGVYQVVKK